MGLRHARIPNVLGAILLQPCYTSVGIFWLLSPSRLACRLHYSKYKKYNSTHCGEGTLIMSQAVPSLSRGVILLLPLPGNSPVSCQSYVTLRDCFDNYERDLAGCPAIMAYNQSCQAKSCTEKKGDIRGTWGTVHTRPQAQSA